MKDKPFEERAIYWLLKGDVGISSKVILNSTLASRGSGTDLYYLHYPNDSSDFGRCRALLELIPECGRGLARLADKDPIWHALFDYWVILDRLYIDRFFETLNSFLQEIIRTAHGRASSQK